jgi:hypothetical protein
MRLGDDVREVCLKSYFDLCKEKAAKKFINWRIQQASIIKDESMKRVIRIKRLLNYKKYNREESIL